MSVSNWVKSKWLWPAIKDGTTTGAGTIRELRKALVSRNLQAEMCRGVEISLRSHRAFSDLFRVISVSAYAETDATRIVAVAKDFRTTLVFAKTVYDQQIHIDILSGVDPIRSILAGDGWLLEGSAGVGTVGTVGSVKRPVPFISMQGSRVRNAITVNKGGDMDKYGTPMDLVDEMVKTAGVEEHEAVVAVSAGEQNRLKARFAVWQKKPVVPTPATEDESKGA